jgi:hypothetical protein
MAAPQMIEKPAYNEEFRICDFSTILGTDTISTGTVTIVDSLNVDVSASMISSVTVPSGSTTVRYMLKGGTANEKYNLSVKASTVGLQKFVEPFTVCIS